jgi:hypothetical protein
VYGGGVPPGGVVTMLMAIVKFICLLSLLPSVLFAKQLNMYVPFVSVIVVEIVYVVFTPPLMFHHILLIVPPAALIVIVIVPELYVVAIGLDTVRDTGVRKSNSHVDKLDECISITPLLYVHTLPYA